jgi:hypothetical protein
MMLADAEHDKKIENNVRECIARAQDKCSKLKDDLVKHAQKEAARNSAPLSSEIIKLQDALDRARDDLADREQELSSLKLLHGGTLVHTPEQRRATHTPRGQAQAVRDLSKLLSDPTRRGTEEFESDLDEQVFRSLPFCLALPRSLSPVSLPHSSVALSVLNLPLAFLHSLLCL